MMASEPEDMAVTAVDSKNEEEQPTLESRVASPSLSAAGEMVSTTSIQANLPGIKPLCDVAETGVRTMASATISSAQPLPGMSQIDLAPSLEEPRVVSIEKQRQQHSYYMHLGSLSTEICQKAYQNTWQKVQETKQKIHETLSHLQQATDLFEYAKQNVDWEVHDGQEKLRQMWSEWDLSQSENCSMRPAEMEFWAASIAQQLPGFCQILLANMQGLLAIIQEMMQHAYGIVEELQAILDTVKSFQELSNGFLMQSCEKMGKAWEAFDEIVAYVKPFAWVVEPFSPGATSAETRAEPAKETERQEA